MTQSPTPTPTPTPTPRIVVVLPQADADAGSPDAPLAMADLLAREVAATFEVVLVGAERSDPQVVAMDRRVSTVWSARHPELDPDPHTDCVLQACEEALRRIGLSTGGDALVLLPAGARGDEIAARLAVRFDGAALGRCIDLDCRAGTVHVHRAAFGGRAHLSIEAGRGPCFGTIRRIPRARGAGAAAEPVGAPAFVPVDLTAPLPPAYTVRRSDTGERMRPLEGARIVISGGRGMESPDGFALLHQVADSVDAAVGGSLPAVDAGWVPVSRQIGQSGKYVAPRLYVAVAVSGTPQHLAGIGPDTRILAINKDPDADIFHVAETGVVADWKELLPVVLARLRNDAAADEPVPAQSANGGSCTHLSSNA